MAFKSHAQIKKFDQLRKEGKVGLDTIALMSMGTDLASLPERVKSDEPKTDNGNPKNRQH